jgi:hypothetical protein
MEGSGSVQIITDPVSRGPQIYRSYGIRDTALPTDNNIFNFTPCTPGLKSAIQSLKSEVTFRNKLKLQHDTVSTGTMSTRMKVPCRKMQQVPCASSCIENSPKPFPQPRQIPGTFST